MRVLILEHTPNPERVVASAARQCYSEGFVGDTYQIYSALSNDVLLRKVLSMGHTSILEHASFTFAIKGISRACSHQLVRFRHASYSQQSQRYVEFNEGIDYVIPYTIQMNPELVDEFEQKMEEINDFYKHMVSKDIPAEDARFILPNATETNLVMTMNARELHHMFALRCCVHAQWEIRELAHAILDLVKNVAPVLFEKAGASCDTKGACPEGARTCGRLN